ncbi:helix-turn-helix domain-containing protein [Candidatus Woesearchaeota archaeon]|jgi:DNA-binding transcriptional ArsR family regulator|nr:helix-turn-helix domain-containing protein [Candidatus Woesearchaeota archaeon]MBT7062736.1 helix-turn-helix domain-containing protein [Candidatus Woesearchaeota archaeon]MBT7402981.1 helix-turn-helix domain-containing protein [Candidatus Woesearchaeota archaeon]
MVVKFLSPKTAKILSNKTARKILEALDKKKSISQIAKELDLPLTTVDYNITQLEKAGLIKSGYYKWSKRGNKMKLYETAGEIFVFAPQEKQPSFIDALNKMIVPSILGISAVSGFITQKLFYGGRIVLDESVASKLGTREAMSSTQASDVLVEPAVASAVNISQAEPQLWFWFMVAAGLVMLVLYLLKKRVK